MHSTTPYKTAVHRLSIGRMLSVAGGEVAFVALMALVFGRTHSAIWGSAALLAVIGTYGLAAPFAGMLGDRFDRRIVMICSDAAGAVVNLALVFVHAPIAADRARRAGRDRAVAVPLGLDRRPSRTSCRPTSSCGRTPRARAPATSASCSARSPAACSSRASAARTPSRSTRSRWRPRRRSPGASSAPSTSTTGEKLRGGLGAGFRFLWNDRVLRWITGAWVLILRGRRRPAGVGVPARRAVRRRLARLRPPDQLVGRRHADRLGRSPRAPCAARRTGRSSSARSASRSCSAASRSRRSSGSCA